MSHTPVPLAHLPTPLEEMDRLAEWLGVPRLLVKRDDLTGLALGGNKARKLEWLCAEARAQGCDTLVTGGGPQSNHARMTVAAANRLGLACHLVVTAPPGVEPSGNLLLDHLLGATLHLVGRREYYEGEAAIAAVAEELRAKGRRPYTIPLGGASATGVCAFAAAVDELAAQRDRGLDGIDWIVVADGTGGTHAGLLAGIADGGVRVLGIDVGTRPDLDEAVPRLAAEAAARTGRPQPRADVLVDHEHFGDGYGILTADGLEAIRRTARLEGILLDPVYSAKAMAGLFTWVRDGRIGRGETVVFWATGGAPALFAEQFRGQLT